MKNLTIHLSSIAPLQFYSGEQPTLPVLEILLSRGRSQQSQMTSDMAIHAETALENLSYARQRLAGEDVQPNDADSGFWYCADPVHLKADRDQVLLTHPASINIQTAEADELVSSFNQLFKEDGIQLLRATAERWYLRSDNPWQLSTTPIEQVEDRSVRELMPQGIDALRWSKVLAEVEMLFFGNSVNRQRDAAGQPLINSLWLWGEQHQHQHQNNHLQWDVLVGEHPLLCGINKLENIPILPSSTSVDELLSFTGNGLVIIDDILNAQRDGVVHQIPKLLLELEQRLFAPLLLALKQGKLNELIIRPANGKTYRIKRSNLIYFWRRSKSVWDRVSHEI